MLKVHAQALCDEVAAGGTISETRFANLERLARVLEIRSDAKSRRGSARWPIVAAVGVTGLITGALLFFRVNQTEIELNVAVSDVDMELSEAAVLTGPMRLTALGISGLRSVRLPRQDSDEDRTAGPSEGSDIALRLSSGVDASSVGSITLATIITSKGANVSLSSGEAPGQFRLSIRSDALSLHADVAGPIDAGLAGERPERMILPIPKAIAMDGRPDGVDLDVVVAAKSKGSFTSLLPVDKLSLFRIDDVSGAENTLVRRVPTVLSGALYFQALNGQERRLRPRESLRFRVARGELRTLELRGDHIGIAFHGHVQGMSTGSDENPVDLMPTYLDWMKARHGLSLFWGTTAYLLTLLAGALRWWRRPE